MKATTPTCCVITDLVPIDRQAMPDVPRRIKTPVPVPVAVRGFDH